MFAWALRIGRAASVPACPSAWRPPGPNPSYRDLLSQLHYTWSEGSFLNLPAPDAPNQPCRRRSQDQAHGTAAQADLHRHGARFPSMINAVRSNADAAQDFKNQRASSARAASTRRKFSASLQGPAGFFFSRAAWQPSRTRGLLLCEQHRHDTSSAQAFKDQRASFLRAASTRHTLSASLQRRAGFFFTSSLHTTQVLTTVPQQEVGCADGLKKRRMRFSRTLCETCVADSLRPANMRYLQVGQRVGGVRYMCAVWTLYFVLQARGRAPVFERERLFLLHNRTDLRCRIAL